MSNIEEENTKKALRTRYLHQRRTLDQHTAQQLNLGLLEQIKKLDLQAVRTAHIFLPIIRQAEPDTELISQWLKEHYPAIRWVICKTERSTSSLYHFVWDEQTVIQENSWGIREPLGGIRVDEQEIDLIFVPLLVFDQQGFRVGYGKGYYDRFLAKCRPDALKVGLSLFEPVADIVDIDQYDIALDLGITPHQTIHFTP